MTDSGPQPPISSPGPRRLVRCDRCNRTDECSASDLLRYTRQGWPRCCDQVMALFTEDEKPTTPPPKTGGAS